jgi:hypothetical protein
VSNQVSPYVHETILAVRPRAATAGGPRREPITAGIPLPRIACVEPRQVLVFDGQGDRLPVQAAVLDRWPDGSIRWLLLDMNVTSPSDLRLAVVDHSEPLHQPREAVTVANEGSRFVVRNGALLVEVRPADGGLMAIRDTRGERSERRVSIAATDKDGSAALVRIEHVRVETSGPCRATMLASGTVGVKDGSLLLEARLHVFAASAAVRLEVTVRNPRRALHRGGFWELGDPGSAYFRDISVRVQHRGSTSRILCYAEPATAPVASSSPIALYQDSSGGTNWQSRVHVNRDGRVPHRFRGYRIEAATVLAAGLRATPVMVVEHDGSSTAACLQNFWQNFPKSLEADERGLTVHLFPKQFDDLHELQAGEQKTHTVGLACGDGTREEPPLSWVLEPSVLSARPEWYAACEAIPFLTPAADSTDAGYETLVNAAIDGNDTFDLKRERIDEYGWRNFGDLYADHETIGHASNHLLVSHYNNQYDAIGGFAIQFMRTGDLRWWTAMEELAAHVVDIDLYHTLDDKAAYNRGLFWHTAHYTPAGRSTHRTYPHHPGVDGGGPSNEHNYSTGLMLDFYLTGRKRSRDAAIQLADWVVAMDDGSQTMFRWLSRAPTGLASATVSSTYHGPGRGAGNSIATLRNAYRLSGERKYRDKADALIRRCIHPNDDLPARQLMDAERRWSYTVFLQVLGRYVHDKELSEEIDAEYSYARASLLHYARWMVHHERPYLERAETLQYPTETWAAQDIRKAEVLELAACYALETERHLFLERARFFFTTAIGTLLCSETRTFTRPVVLLLSNGYSHFALQAGLTSSVRAGDGAADFGRPTRFRPQREVARQRVIGLGAAVVLALLLLVLAVVR